MSALQRYNEHLQTLQSRMEQLEGEKTKLLRQIEFFQFSKERYELLESPNDVENCQNGLDMLNRKLDETNAAIEELNVVPYAAEAMEELLDEHLGLKGEFDSRWEEAMDIRDIYISKLKEIADVKRRSVNLSYASQGVAIALRRNRLEELDYGSNRFEFDIDVSEIL